MLLVWSAILCNIFCSMRTFVAFCIGRGILLWNFSWLATTQLYIWNLILMLSTGRSLQLFVINSCMWHDLVFRKFYEWQICIKWNVRMLLIHWLHWIRWICLATWKKVIVLSAVEAKIYSIIKSLVRSCHVSVLVLIKAVVWGMLMDERITMTGVVLNWVLLMQLK